MSTPRFCEITSLAYEELLNEVKCGYFPIDLPEHRKDDLIVTSYQKYAELTNTSVYHLMLGDKYSDGLSWKELRPGVQLLLYDKEKYPPRLRHTFFHEIGHIKCEHKKHGDIEEVEAHFFAAQTLMPNAIISEIKRRGYIINKKLLMQNFGISNEAAENKLAYLDKYPDTHTNHLDEEIILAFENHLNNLFPRSQPAQDIVFDLFTKLKDKSETDDCVETSTGFNDLDMVISGLPSPAFIIVASRPSMGKTALVSNIACHVAIKEKKPVAFFSLEMSAEQIMQRFMCAEAHIESDKLSMAHLSDDNWTNIIAASDRIANSNLYIDASPALDITQLMNKVRTLKKEKDIQLLIIDYLQLIGSMDGPSDISKYQAASEVSRLLKALSKELNITIIATSQLSRKIEDRLHKVPMLSDLRESGTLEEDADIVAFLYREDYYSYDIDEEKRNIAELIIAKNRFGPGIAKILLYFQKQFFLFRNLSKTQNK